MFAAPPNRSGWPSYYKLLGHTPIAVDALTWASAMDARYKLTEAGQADPWSVAQTDINDRCDVSTVFMGVNHNWREGPPLLFETMIFGGPLDGYQEHFETWEQAERGHWEAVTEARKACAQIEVIARDAGA